MNPARQQGQIGPHGTFPLGAAMASNSPLYSRETECLIPSSQVLQHAQLQQHQKLHSQTSLTDQVLPQQQQQQHRHIIKPPSLLSQRQNEQIHQVPMQQPPKGTHSAACSGRRSRSNSSLTSPEKRSPSQLVNSRGATKCCSSGASCVCTAETRGSFPSADCSRLSFGSTRSSTGSYPFGSRRYATSDSDFNVAAAVDVTAAPVPPAAPSPSGVAAAPSTSLSVGESCTDWGAVSADDGCTSSSNVFVAVRVRPLCEKERRQGDVKTVSVLDNRSLMVTEVGADGGPRGRRVRNRYFIFDSVFGETADQEEVFAACTLPLLHDLFKGINATVFAYGATAAGKTHTMLGCEAAPGLMPRALHLLFFQQVHFFDALYRMTLKTQPTTEKYTWLNKIENAFSIGLIGLQTYKSYKRLVPAGFVTEDMRPRSLPQCCLT